MSERKPFTHLSKVDIRTIVSMYYNGETQYVIADKLGVDQSTVWYHLKKYERTLPEETNVYAVVKGSFRPRCTHPSLKCHLCGTCQDNINSEAQTQIRELTEQLRVANQRLERHGLVME